jgi:uncharacterized protein (DUF1015 family)
MQIKPFKALFAKTNLLGSATEFCENAKISFQKNLESGLFEHHEADCFFVYQIDNGLNKHIGLVGLNHVNDFLEGRIKKHEDTLSDRELEQKEVFLRLKAILKPILVTHAPVPVLTTWLNQYAHAHIPLLSAQFTKGTSVHRFWAVSQADDIALLQSIFAQHITETYIADGHHRTTTTALLHLDPEFRTSGLDLSQLFCAWFASDQLKILDYNRVVEGVKKIGQAKLMALLSKNFVIDILEKPQKPQQKHELVMCLGKDWYTLRWHDFVLELAPNGYDTLDTDLLNRLVINKIFEIIDVRNDTRITYVDGGKGLDGLKKVVRHHRTDRVGFAFFPVAFEDLTRMADAGENLPPKSTYFEPRMKSGLLVRSLEKLEPNTTTR